MTRHRRRSRHRGGRPWWAWWQTWWLCGASLVLVLVVSRSL
ncbi:hypothetical protein [Streptomyces olivaceus]|nr:hypothetical protein [Streptomyces olivaceus]